MKIIPIIFGIVLAGYIGMNIGASPEDCERYMQTVEYKQAMQEHLSKF